MSENSQPPKSEITYGSKNGFNETYDALEKELRHEAVILSDQSKELGLPDQDEALEYFEKQAHDNAQEELDEFRVKDPELAHAMADAEDMERSKAAALRLLDKGIVGYSGAMMRTSKPGTFSRDTHNAEGSRGKVLDSAHEASGHLVNGVLAQSPVPLSPAYNELTRNASKTKYEETTSPLEKLRDKVTGEDPKPDAPITLSDIAREIHPAAKQHEKRAEELGNKAAKQFLKERKDQSERAA